MRPPKQWDKPFQTDIDHSFMSRKQEDEWYDRISRLDPPGYDDRGDEEHTTGQEVPQVEEFEVEEEHEHLRYDRSYFRAQLRH